MGKSTVFPLLVLCLFIAFYLRTSGQKTENSTIQKMVIEYKNNVRGPYKDIRWFCKDGTTRPPQERCPEPGVQRARYKDEVIQLASKNHIFLGQILATTDLKTFWDQENNHSRLKQYMLERYLFRVDNGWIQQKSQYYRGAVQAEDEEQWGLGFFNWLLADDMNSIQNYFLIREAARDIPHQGDDNRTQLIRSLSKEISDSVPDFQNIRIKIHGKPDITDIETVKRYRDRNKSKLSALQFKKMDELITNMEIVFQPADLNSLKKYLKQIPTESEASAPLQSLISEFNSLKSGKERVGKLAENLLIIRQSMLHKMKGNSRLAFLDISVKLEEILFREVNSWKDKTLQDLIQKSSDLSKAAAGCGYIELWEWEELRGQYDMLNQRTLSMKELNDLLESSRKAIEWSTGMMRANFKDVIELYGPFEPKAGGFIDDRIRSSILLHLGDCVSNLGSFISSEANLTNTVMDIKGQSHFRGLNPGYALGELVVMNEITDKTEISADKIYVFDHPPADLKPVAGIATVSEGNLVSHVQLLARNLGIPNAVLSSDNLESLKRFNGQRVFYAVSKKGTVIMKPADQMTSVEKKLFEVKKQQESRIKVPTEKIQLQKTQILNLRDIQASQSGVVCGPKAANLGQLKMLFPENVVEGFVIPFGIFRQHMDQNMPGQNGSYWDFLNGIFETTKSMSGQRKTEKEIDDYTLKQLEILREAIKKMPLRMDFIADIENQFRKIFGKELGEVPVFLRSDTNMEDLKDFTGAGLNLTLFNVLAGDKILQGIKDVWASPYAERSYKWRQKILLNPENVYPSILIIPSVNVDCSGVLITKGIQSDAEDDLTIAFSRGAGGAVEGQAAETWLLKANGDNILQSPAREPIYNTLPSDGGTEKSITTFEKQILSLQNLDQIRSFAEKIKVQMTKQESASSGPYDIELGLKTNKIWLFQIRPFVENKNTRGSEYLESISPDLPTNKKFDINTTLKI